MTELQIKISNFMSCQLYSAMSDLKSNIKTNIKKVEQSVADLSSKFDTMAVKFCDFESRMEVFEDRVTRIESFCDVIDNNNSSNAKSSNNIDSCLMELSLRETRKKNLILFHFPEFDLNQDSVNYSSDLDKIKGCLKIIDKDMHLDDISCFRLGIKS